MRKGLTEVVFILDRSGSMRGLEEDTIGGCNSMIEKQRKEDGEAYISTVLFDDKNEILYDRVPVAKVEPMNEKQYYVRGCTALLDAIKTADRFGIGADRAMNYQCDREGTQLNFQVLSTTISAFRKSRSKSEMDEALFSGCAPIREDYEKRHKDAKRGEEDEDEYLD